MRPLYRKGGRQRRKRCRLWHVFITEMQEREVKLMCVNVPKHKTEERKLRGKPNKCSKAFCYRMSFCRQMKIMKDDIVVVLLLLIVIIISSYRRYHHHGVGWCWWHDRSDDDDAGLKLHRACIYGCSSHDSGNLLLNITSCCPLICELGRAALGWIWRVPYCQQHQASSAIQTY